MTLPVTIPTGKHYSRPRRLQLHWRKTELIREIKFNSSVKYNLYSVDQWDINKLFGISYGYHHHNSVRFGWRWNLKENKLEILAYIYINKKRIQDSLAFIDLHQDYQFKIIKQEHQYLLSIIDPETSQTIVHKTYPAGKGCPLGYLLHPYFGGNCSAPHKITFDFF